MATGSIIGVDALPDSVIDFALAERRESCPNGASKPQEMEMIEGALIRFRGDKSKAARAIGWTPNVPKKTNRPREWTVGFRGMASAWRRAAA
jgi:hypothetical protein